MGFAVAAKGATSPADAAIQRYQRCGSDSGCIAAARAEMLGVQQEMRAAGVPLQERVSSGINANIAQASVLLGEMDAALQATGAVGITSLTNQAGGGKTKGATETVRVGELIATHGKTMSNKQLDKLIKNIRAEGIKEPLTVTEHQGKLYILDGHHRALAAPRAGVAEVPIKRVELPFGAYKTPADLDFTPGGY